MSPSAPSMAPLQRGQILGEAAQHLQHRFLVVEEHVAPHGRIGRGDAREVAEAAGRELDDLLVGHAFQVLGRIDDVVGDEMRHVAGDRQHHVVVLRRHDLDLRAERLPERLELVHRRRIGVRLRRQDAPAAVEQLRKARLRARLLGARDRMAGHEVHAVRHVRGHVAHDGGLHRADVRENGAGLADAARSLPQAARRRPPARRG